MSVIRGNGLPHQSAYHRPFQSAHPLADRRAGTLDLSPLGIRPALTAHPPSQAPRTLSTHPRGCRLRSSTLSRLRSDDNPDPIGTTRLRTPLRCIHTVFSACTCREPRLRRSALCTDQLLTGLLQPRVDARRLPKVIRI